MDNCNLLQKIEQCRKEMILLSHSHGYTSEIVVKTSKRLDSLLNKYEKTIKNAS
ncbi:Spo0E family sporulation regulatory protein-aspartic acid phosphatase [Virgibacillus flavescens]|uniref:Spo0E family sporulation regulatory protein-aspartic acid phosphatase n=1 Tax=Virgibacillus flavescens TaxID=1611422 RepID=UPI003D357E32